MKAADTARRIAEMDARPICYEWGRLPGETPEQRRKRAQAQQAEIWNFRYYALMRRRDDAIEERRQEMETMRGLQIAQREIRKASAATIQISTKPN
jgi:hypothetical protein